MTTTKRIKFQVFGRVQGVGFRFSTLMEAANLRLVGYVRNLSDGSVQGVAEGTGTQLYAFENWLKKGPKYSNVTDLIVEPDTSDETFTEFEIR